MVRNLLGLGILGITPQVAFEGAVGVAQELTNLIGPKYSVGLFLKATECFGIQTNILPLLFLLLT